MFDIKDGCYKVKYYIENDFVLATPSFSTSQYCQKKIYCLFYLNFQAWFMIKRYMF